MVNNIVEKWIAKLTKAEEQWADYHRLVEEIRKYYKNENNKNKQNVFWSSIETLKPFVYFKPPKPYVKRKNKKENAVQDVACQILEKALVANMESQDFDGVIKYARNDYLISGLGCVFEKIQPVVKDIGHLSAQNDNAVKMPQEILETVNVETNYMDPKELIFDVQNVKVWEDVAWVAQKIEMTKGEVIEQFGAWVEPFFVMTKEGQDELDCVTDIYRIWAKKERKVLYLSKEIKETFLRIDDDVLKLSGFYPFAKPVFATLANDGIIPVPDYVQIKCLLDELDGVNSRMKLIMQALKISGAYDGSFPELANILNKDVTLVEISDFEKLREKGGIGGVMEFAPIEQYVQTLEVLSERRKMLVQAVYEITGVSDIMRGNANPSETATAVIKKTNFGTLRNQDRQNDFQRFVGDVLKIKAELICEQMPFEMLADFAPDIDREIVMQAVLLLKQEKLRNLTLGIETDISFHEAEEMQKTNEAVAKIHEMIVSAFSVVSNQPLLLPLYKQMIESLVVTLPQARQFSAAIEDVFGNLEKVLFSEDDKTEDIEMMKVQAEIEKNRNDFEIKRQANALKQEEINLKKQMQADKVALTNKEMNLQAGLESAKIAENCGGQSNIATGYVKGF